MVFNTVLNELSRGLEEEEDDSHQTPSIAVIGKDALAKDIIGMADQLFNILRQRDPTLEMKYNKISIVLAKVEWSRVCEVQAQATALGRS